MFSFEVKKLIKTHVLWATLLLSFLMALYVNFQSNESFALDENYPSYDLARPGVIFNSVVFNQAYQLEDEERAAFFQDLNASNEETARHNKSKLQSFLAHVKEKSFPERYEVAPLLQALDYQELQDYKAMMEKYHFQISNEAERKTFNYGIFESEYYHDQGILFTRGEEEILSTNYVRRIIYNSRAIFGPAFVGFLILVFYGTICQERNLGTLYLLETQPFGRKKIIRHKIFIMMLVAVLYLVSFLFFFLLVCLIQGIHIGGFQEIYRLYHPEADIRYMKAGSLLPLILISFLTITLLFSTLILLVSTLARNKESSLATLLVLFGLGYVLTENISFLQVAWNPIYALDAVRMLTGKAQTTVSLTGDIQLNNIFYHSPAYLLPFFLFALLTFLITNVFFYHHIQFHDRPKDNKVHYPGIFHFEIRKIMQKRSFLIYLLGGLLFVFALHAFQVGPVKEKIRFYTEEDGLLKQKKEDVAVYEDQVKKAQEGELNEASLELLKEAQIQLQRQEKLVQSYQNKDSVDFYRVQSEISMENFDRTGSNPWIYKRDLPTIFDRLESQKLDQVAGDRGVTPLLRPDFYSSAYEAYRSPLVAREMESRGQYQSNSGLYTFLRMLQYQHFDILFLSLILFMVLEGYVVEKENGQQLSLIYTQPLGRFRFHFTKVLAQELVINIVYLILALFILFLGFITEGFGDPRQPVIYYQTLYESVATAAKDQGNALNSLTTIPITSYLFRAFLAIACQGLFLSSLASLLSIFTKKKTTLIAWTGFLTVGGILLSGATPFPSLKILNPFTYLFAGQVANNAVMVKNGIPGASYPLSLFTLIFWAAILTLLGGIMTLKRDQL